MKKKFALFLIVMTFLGIVNAQNHYWTPIIGNQYTMTVTGVIVINEVQQTVTTLEIGAFCGDECRASHFAQLFPPTGDYVVTMTIRSRVESGETISFRLYDHVTQQELDVECLNTVEYVANTQIGTMNDWFQFAFASTGIQNVSPGAWSNANIWSGGSLPGVNDAVIISEDCSVDIDVEVAALTVNSGARLSVLTGNTLTVNGAFTCNDVDGLVIEDGAQIVNESEGVKATAKKNIQAYTQKDPDGWHFLASPVDNMVIEGSDFILEIYDLYRYNETIPIWENYRVGHEGFTTFENGRGYLYANSNTFSPVFQGVLNNASITRTLTYTEWDKSLSGVNLIGNPFPHKIYKGAGGAIDDHRLASGYYSLNYYGGWETYTYETPIMPGQGFVVITTENTELSIEKTNAQASDESSLSKQSGRLKINIEGTRNGDRTFVYFSDGIGLGKLENFSTSLPALSIRHNGAEYAVAHISEDCESIDLVFRNTVCDDFALGFETDNLTFDYLHLIDGVNGDDIDLLSEPIYRFHANGDEDENRFKLICRNVNSIGENIDDSMFAYVMGDDIIVSGKGILEVIDMSGRVINTLTVNGMQTVEVPSAGVYVLRFINGSNVQTQKIVISQ